MTRTKLSLFSRHTVYRSAKLREQFIENDIPLTKDDYNMFVEWKGNTSLKGFGTFERVMASYIEKKKTEQETHPITVHVKKDGDEPFPVTYNMDRGIKSLIEMLGDHYDENKQILCCEFDEKTYDNDQFAEVKDGETIYLKNIPTKEKFRGRFINGVDTGRYVYIYKFTVGSEHIYLEYNKQTNTFQLFDELEDNPISDEKISLTECLKSNTRNWTDEMFFNIARLYQSHRYVY